MKFVSTTAVAVAALLQAVNADFDVYAAGIGGNGIAGNAWGYQIYDGTANCDNNLDWIWRSSGDVSGGKYGVRCKGPGDSCDSSGDPTGLEEMEFNFNSDDHHWTLYSGRGWGLFDLSDNQVGSCAPIPAPGDEFFCGAGLGRAEGQHKIHCTTDAASAADINSHRP